MTRLSSIRPGARLRMAGMTLMEILVAMAIGLIGIVVITQTYLVNENYKRSTTSAGGAQTNGSLALYSIERDVRMGGWGFAWSSVFGCNGVQWYYDSQGYSNPPGGPLPLLNPVPVRIVDGGTAPDSITAMYGTSTERLMPATLSKTMTNAGDSLEVDNAQVFRTAPGDLVILSQGANCAMVQITSVTGGQLEHVNGINAPYNPPGVPTFPAFAVNSLVFNLGRPVVNTYALNNGKLEVTSLFTSTSSTVVPSYTPIATPIVENIVDLQAEYGKDNGVDNGTVPAGAFAANDNIVDSYDNVMPANSTEWGQVLSVRIGVLARSEHYVRPATAGAPCTATTAAPTWANGKPFTALGDFTDTTNQARCYGYRVFETVVPLRNMIWRQG